MQAAKGLDTLNNTLFQESRWGTIYFTASGVYGSIQFNLFQGLSKIFKLD
jgi:hypothetical protein